MVNQTINLNFASKEVQPRLYASQGDTGEHIFTIRCFMEDEKYVIPENSVVTINGRKPGNTIFIVPGEYTDNIITFDCTEGMTDTRGYVMCEVAVVTESGVTQSGNFVLYVEREVIEGGGSDLSALIKMLENKQDKLTPGSGIRIYVDDTTGELKIAATGGGGGTEYTAGDGIDITNDVISALRNPTNTYTKDEVDSLLNDKTYFSGDGISIDENNIISADLNPDNTYEKADVDALLADKQDKLESGTNLKTVNGISLLGAGNIDAKDIAVVTYDESSYAVVKAAIEADKAVFLKLSETGPAYHCYFHSADATKCVLSFIKDTTATQLVVSSAMVSSNDEWTMPLGSDVIFSSKSYGDATYAAKASLDNIYTKTEVDDKIAAIEHVSVKEVSTLPTTGESGYIYLVPKISGGYEQYIWGDVGGTMQFIDIGPEEIDLSAYVKTTDLATQLATKQDNIVAGTAIQIAGDGKTVSVKPNSVTDPGYVPAPTASNKGKVYKTDSNGVPAWRDEAPNIVIDTTSTSITLAQAAKNTVYIYGTLSALTVSDIEVGGIVDIIFTSGATATTVTLPSGVTTPSDYAIEANKTYELNIMNGLLLMGVW